MEGVWNWVPLEQPPGTHLLKNFPTFYRARRFISHRQWPLPVRFPLEAWMSPVRVCALFYCCTMQVTALRGLIPRPGNLIECEQDYEAEEAPRAPRKGCRATDEQMNVKITLQCSY
jgi:hypothetical protein